MRLEHLIRMHEVINRLGDAIWEQFVTVVEAGDSDSMLAEEEAGRLNRNAVREIVNALGRLRMNAEDDTELVDEIDELKVEVIQFLETEEES